MVINFTCLTPSLLLSYLLWLHGPVQSSILPMFKLSVVPNASLDCVTSCVVRQCVFAYFVGLHSRNSDLPCRITTLLFAATDGEGGEEGEDEEQGGGDGGEKDKKGQSHKAQPDQQRGMLKTPVGQHQQVRSRTNGQEANGHTHTEYEPQQYQTPQYAPQPQPYVNDSPNEYETYRSPEPLTRYPSINMDWQTLRVPR